MTVIIIVKGGTKLGVVGSIVISVSTIVNFGSGTIVVSRNLSSTGFALLEIDLILIANKREKFVSKKIRTY